MGICEVSKKIDRVILALAEKPMTRKEVAFTAGVAGGTVKKVVDWLLSNNLAREKVKSRYEVDIELTEKGKKLAELIRQINELVGDP